MIIGGATEKIPLFYPYFFIFYSCQCIMHVVLDNDYTFISSLCACFILENICIQETKKPSDNSLEKRLGFSAVEFAKMAIARFHLLVTMEKKLMKDADIANKFHNESNVIIYLNMYNV